jgi:hypothetical protein
MLAPALAFAWWIVSMPGSPQDDGRAEGATDDEAALESDGDADGPTLVDPAESNGERAIVRLVTPDITRTARTFLQLPMGTEQVVKLGGQRYVFVLEPHYHPRGYVGGPNGWHKGVTAYELR